MKNLDLPTTADELDRLSRTLANTAALIRSNQLAEVPALLDGAAEDLNSIANDCEND